MAEADLWEIKTRIRDILAADTTLAAYFRSFQVGAPNANIPDDPMPYLFVTNDEILIQEDEEWHVENNTPSTSKHTLHFLIAMLDSGKDGATVEKKLDDISKTVKQTLKANYHLLHPATLTDPKAFRSYPQEIRALNREKIGEEVQGRAIFFKVTAYL